jgi:hypothetical protein
VPTAAKASGERATARATGAARARRKTEENI